MLRRPALSALARMVVVLGLVALSVGWCGAQVSDEETEAAPSAEAETGVVPDLSDQAVTGEAVVDLADFICGCLNDSGAVPDWAQVQTVSGRLRRVSAAEAFALLARTVYLWNESGELPATVPLTPQQVDPPQLDEEDLPGDDYDPEAGREVPTEDFLSWCADIVYWIDRLHSIPTAVWLDGQRLSATEYLAGLAICIQYGYYEGDLLDYIFLPHYLPPNAWVRAFQAQVAQGYQEEAYDEGTGAAEESEAQGEEAGSPGGLAGPEAPPPVFSEPKLALSPEPGTQVSGVVDVLAAYTGPPPAYVIFGVDRRTREMTNREPYSFRWDTSALAPGPHSLRVRIFGKDGALLIDQVSIYTVAAPKPVAPPAGEQAGK